MKTDTTKILGIGATILGMAATLVSSIAEKKERENLKKELKEELKSELKND